MDPPLAESQAGWPLGGAAAVWLHHSLAALQGALAGCGRWTRLPPSSFPRVAHHRCYLPLWAQASSSEHCSGTL
jgi:hypothetical protein